MKVPCVRPAHLLALGLSGGMGCAPAKYPGIEGPVAEELRTRPELTGDKAVGEVLFIRQIHRPPIFPFEVEQLSSYEDAASLTVATWAGMVKAGIYQAGILDVLVQVQPQHLFLEGATTTFAPEASQRHMEGLRAEWEAAATHPIYGPFMSRVDPRNPEGQLMMLALFGAGSVYAATFEGVTVHQTTSRDDVVQDGELMDFYGEKHGSAAQAMNDPEFIAPWMDGMEDRATRSVIEFLTDNPGEKIVLVFGAAHNFCDDFVRYNFIPKMDSIWFTDLDYPLPSLPEECK